MSKYEEFSPEARAAFDAISKVPVRFKDGEVDGKWAEIPVFMPEHQAENIALALEEAGVLKPAAPFDGTVQAIRVQELKEGDIIIYSCPRRLEQRDAESVSKLLQGMFPKHKIAMVDEGAKIDVVRP